MNASYPKLLVILVIAAVLLGLVASFVVSRAEKSREDMPVYSVVPDFAFTERSGEPFGSDDMLGTVNIVSFMFTRCKSICPTTSAHLAELYDLYDDSDLVRIVSVSVDPEYDTLAALRAYAERFGVDDDRWVFLRAPVEEVQWLSEEGFMLAADDLPGGHTAKFALVDAENRIRSYHNGLDPAAIEVLKQNVRVLARDIDQ